MMAASRCWQSRHAISATQGVWSSHPHAHRVHAPSNQIPCPPVPASQAHPLRPHEPSSKLQRPRPFIPDPLTHEPAHLNSQWSSEQSLSSSENLQKSAADEPSLPASILSTSEVQQDDAQLQRQRRFQRRARQLRRQEVLHLGPLDAAAAALMSGETDPGIIVPLLAAGSRGSCASPASQLLQGHAELMAACAKLGMRLPGSVMLPWGAIIEPLLSPSSQQQGFQAAPPAPSPAAPPVTAQQQQLLHHHYQQQQQQQQQEQQQEQRGPGQDRHAQHPQALWMATLQQQQQQQHLQPRPGFSLPNMQPKPDHSSLEAHRPSTQAPCLANHQLLWPHTPTTAPPQPRTSVHARHGLDARAIDPKDPPNPIIPPPHTLQQPLLSTGFYSKPLSPLDPATSPSQPRSPSSPLIPTTLPLSTQPRPLPYPSSQPPSTTPRRSPLVPHSSLTSVDAAAWHSDCALRLLEACSRLGHHLGHPAMEALTACLDPCWPALLPQQLVTCLKALAHLDFFPQHPPGWLQGALKSVTAQLSYFNASQVCAVLRSVAQLDTNEWANPRHIESQAELVRALAARRELHTEIMDLLPPINPHALHPSVMPKEHRRLASVRAGVKQVSPSPPKPGMPASGTPLRCAGFEETGSPTSTAAAATTAISRGGSTATGAAKATSREGSTATETTAATSREGSKEARTISAISKEGSTATETTAATSRGGNSPAPAPMRRQLILLPASGTRMRPLQRRMQERDVRLGLWLLMHFQMPVSRQWLWALLAGAARRSRVLSPAALVATFQIMAMYRWLPPFAARHRLWLWVQRRWRSLSSYHTSMLLTWALKAGTQPPPVLVQAAVASVERSGVKSMRAYAAGRWSRHFGDCKRVRDVARVLWVAWQCSSRQQLQAPLAEGQVHALSAALAQGLLDSVPWRPSKAHNSTSQQHRNHLLQQQQQQSEGTVVAIPGSELALVLWSLAMYATAPNRTCVGMLQQQQQQLAFAQGSLRKTSLNASSSSSSSSSRMGRSSSVDDSSSSSRSSSVSTHKTQLPQLSPLSEGRQMLQEALGFAMPRMLRQQGDGAIRAGDVARIVRAAQLLQLQLPHPLLALLLNYACAGVSSQVHVLVACQQLQQQRWQQQEMQEMLPIKQQQQQQQQQRWRLRPAELLLLLQSIAHLPEDTLAAVLRSMPPDLHPSVAANPCTPQHTPHNAAHSHTTRVATQTEQPPEAAAAGGLLFQTHVPAPGPSLQPSAPATPSRPAAAASAASAAQPDNSAADMRTAPAAADSSPAPAGAPTATVAAQLRTPHGMPEHTRSVDGAFASPMRAVGNSAVPFFQQRRPPPHQLLVAGPEARWAVGHRQQQQQQTAWELLRNSQHQLRGTPLGSNNAIAFSAPEGPTHSTDATHGNRSRDACLPESEPCRNNSGCHSSSSSSSSNSRGNPSGRSKLSKQGHFTERIRPQSPRFSSPADATAERWVSIAHTLPSLAALCEALPPRALASAAGDALFVEGLTAISRLKLRMGQGWLQVCAAEVALMLSTRGPPPPASLVHLLHATASLPLHVPPLLLESALPSLLMPVPSLASAEASTQSSRNSSSSSSSSRGRKNASTNASTSGAKNTRAKTGTSGFGSGRQASSSNGLQQRAAAPQQQQQQQQEWLMAVSPTDSVAVLWLCSQTHLRVPPSLLHAMRSTVHTYLSDLSPGNLARAVLGLAEIQSTHNCGVSMKSSNSSSSNCAAMPRSSSEPTITNDRQQKVGVAQLGGGMSDTKAAPVGGQQLDSKHSRALQDGVMQRLVENVPVSALLQAAQPGFAWGSRAKASGAQKGMPGTSTSSSSSSSSSMGTGGGGIHEGSGVGNFNEASIASTVCAMSPDQLCSALLGLAKWQQQRRKQPQQQQKQQLSWELKEEWLGALLALVQARTRGVMSSHGLLRCTSALLLLQHAPSVDFLRTLKRRAWNLKKSKLMSADDVQLFGHHHQLLQQQAGRPRGMAKMTTTAAAEAARNSPSGAPVLDQRATSGVEDKMGVAVMPVMHHHSHQQQQQQQNLDQRATSGAGDKTGVAMTAVVHCHSPQQQEQQQEREQRQQQHMLHSRPPRHRPALFAAAAKLLRRLPLLQPQQQWHQQQQQQQEQISQLQSPALLPGSRSEDPPPTLSSPQLSAAHSQPNNRSAYLQRLQEAFHSLALRMMLGVGGSSRSGADLAAATSDEVGARGISQEPLLLDAPPQPCREELREGSLCSGLASAAISEGDQRCNRACHVTQLSRAEVPRASPPEPPALCLPASFAPADSSSSSSSSSGHIGNSHSGRDRKPGVLEVEYVRGLGPQVGRPVHLLELMLRLKFQYTINTATQRRRKLRLQ